MQRLHDTVQELSGIILNCRLVQQRSAKALQNVCSVDLTTSRDIALGVQDGVDKVEDLTRMNGSKLETLTHAIDMLSRASKIDNETLQSHLEVLKGTAASQNELVTSLLLALGQRMKEIETISQNQSESLLSVLQQLSACNQTSENCENRCEQAMRTRADPEDTDTTKGTQDGMDEAIRILREYASDKEKTVYSKEVERIIDALDYVLQFLLDPENTSDTKSISFCNDLDRLDGEEYSVKMIGRLVSGSQQVCLNRKGLWNIGSYSSIRWKCFS